MTYRTERIQGPILYQTSDDDVYKFSSTEKNFLTRQVALRPDTDLEVQSRVYDSILDTPGMEKLHEYVSTHINNYAHEVMQVTDDITFYITQSWVTVSQTGVGQQMNMHLNNILTGMMFISPEEGGESIYFADGRNEVFPGIDFPYKQIPYSAVQYTPGRLAIWPSKVPYSVPPNKCQEDRVSLSFNVHFHGDLGRGGINAIFNTLSRSRVGNPNDLSCLNNYPSTSNDAI